MYMEQQNEFLKAEEADIEIEKESKRANDSIRDIREKVGVLAARSIETENKLKREKERHEKTAETASREIALGRSNLELEKGKIKSIIRNLEKIKIEKSKKKRNMIIDALLTTLSHVGGKKKRKTKRKRRKGKKKSRKKRTK